MRTPSIAAAAVLYVCTLVPAAIASVPARSSLDADLGAALTAAPLSPAEFDDLVAFVRRTARSSRERDQSVSAGTFDSAERKIRIVF